jgi:cell division protein FtsW
MIRALKGTDRVLLGTSAFLLLLGLVTLASASVALSFKQFGHAYYYILRQVILGVGVGSLLFFLGLKISPHIYRKYALPLLLLSIITVSLVFVSGIGFGTGVARRWIHLGPLSFQPSEMLKLAFIIYLAAWMTSKKEYLTSLTHGLIPFLILVGLMGALLIAEPDLGTLGVLATSSLGVFFIGGGKTKQVLVSAAAGLLILSIVVTAVPYARDRFFVFLNPSAESQGRGYQISQARIAIGSGGLFGRGIGLSRQKYYYFLQFMLKSLDLLALLFS